MNKKENRKREKKKVKGGRWKGDKLKFGEKNR